MNISFNPLFRISDALSFIKYIDFYNAPWISKENDRVIPFSRGQWALRELAVSIARKRNKTKCFILIPEYFCEISLTPLRIPDFDIHFYRITLGLEPDINDLNRIARKHGSPDVMLFVHFFGIPLNMNAAEMWCKENDVLIVEDAAHSLLPVPGIGNHGYPVIYTPWKFLNLPEGALLILPVETGISMKATDRDNNPLSNLIWWMTRQLILRMVHGMKLPLQKIRKPHIKECDESEPPIDPGKPGCARLSMAVLSQKAKNIKIIGKVRERNYRMLDAALVASGAEKSRVFRNLPTHFTPYAYPLRLKGASNVDFMTALNRMGIPAQPWSDLSPEVKNSAQYPLSNALRREVVVLPVHQDLSLSQIDWMAQEVSKLLTHEKIRGAIAN